MATRTARGRLMAASAHGLVVALAILAGARSVCAQQFADGGEFTFADDESYVPQMQSENYSGETPNYWGADCGPSGCDGCLDECGEYGGCGDGCCGCELPGAGCPCPSYASDRVWWVGIDYLVWRIDGTKLPVLLTDSPVGTLPLPSLPTTSVLAGNVVTGNTYRSGYRLRTGVWLDECHDLAITGDYFQLGDDEYNFYFAGDSGRNTGRPFLNTQTGTQDLRLISGPNLNVNGTFAVSNDDDFQGAGVTLERSVYAIGDVSGYGPGTQVILIGGYRFYSYDSRLTISDHVTTLSGADAGMQSFKRDDFATSNEFHGGEFGAQVRYTQQRCWFDGLVKIAVGGQRSTVTINGETTTIPAGMAAETEAGGLLTSSETNIGKHTNSYGRVIPEFRMGFGYYITPHWVARAGYSAIVWSGVAHPAAEVPPHLAVDPLNIPPGAGNGGAAPLFPGVGGSELVAHGLDLGIEYTY